MGSGDVGFKEFKVVGAEGVVVERILPIERIGEAVVRQAEELSEAEKKKAKAAAVSAGVGMRKTEILADEGGQFGTSQVDYIYEQPPEELFRAPPPQYLRIQIFRPLMQSVSAAHT